MATEKMPYFPMFVDLSSKKIVVFGAGTIAKRRIRSLMPFTNHLYVIAPEVNNELLNYQKDGKIKILQKNYECDDLFDADLVIAATNDHQTNNEIYSLCKCMGITVNVCSDKSKCDFYFPGIIRKDMVVIGVTASGQDHKMAKAATEKIRTVLDTD